MTRWLLTFIVVLLAPNARAENPSPCTLQIELKGIIGPASLDFLERALKRTENQGCSSMLVLINTPGGSLQTTRLMVERILNSPFPILCLVAPSGGHAGSAGAILLAACHVNGAMVATNLGAATPILGDGMEMPEDLRRKVLNDTRSWMNGITALRGRDKKFGEDIIMKAKAVSAEEALKLGAIDTVVTKIEDFLAFAKGRKVKMTENSTAEVEVGERHYFSPDLRFQALDLLASPETAYLILMASLALIYFEVTHPGVIAPGVLGGMGLIVSLVALHKLNVEWGGLALIILGLALLIAEAFVPSFGALGIGGLIAFILGSLFLFDPVETGGYRLPWRLILPTALLIGSLMMTIAFVVLKTRRAPKRGGFDDIIGATGVVVSVSPQSEAEGQLEMGGEIWGFMAPKGVQSGSRVRVVGRSGLTLMVEEEKES